jgi:hypothetical protein
MEQLHRGPPWPSLERLIQTWPDGNRGLYGTRLVAKDDSVVIDGRLYRSPLLNQKTGGVVYFKLVYGRPHVEFFNARWSPPDKSGHQKARPGLLICRLEPV